jgi:hypothetical protein
MRLMGLSLAIGLGIFSAISGWGLGALASAIAFGCLYGARAGAWLNS